MQSYPFTSQVTYDEQGLPLYDRAVDSEFLRKVFARYFSDGVFYKPTSALQVVADSGMQVKVNPGCCHIQGAIGIEDTQRTLVVQAAEALDRIDTVVARLDLSVAVRSIDLYVVKGTAGESPQAPALTRDSTIWELGLANIFVAKNTATISQQRITDTRLDTSRCGMVAQTIGSLDTGPFFAQLQQALAENEAEAEQLIQYLQQQIAAVEGDTAWMLKSVYDSTGQNRDVFHAMVHLYKATFLLDGWTGDGPYTQTVALVPVDGGPPVTSNSTLLAYEGIDSTLPQETKDAMSGPAGEIAKAAKTLGDNTITVTLDSAPDVDVEIYFSIKQGVEPAVPPLDPVGAGSGMKLLWENPNPLSNFPAQKVSVPVSDYDFIAISAITGPGEPSVASPVLWKVGLNSIHGLEKVGGYLVGNANSQRYRNFTVQADGVTFEVGHSLGTVQEGICIPTYILGIKI